MNSIFVGLRSTLRILGKNNLPVHLPHMLPFVRRFLHLCSVKLVQVLKKPPGKIDLDQTLEGSAGGICLLPIHCGAWLIACYSLFTRGKWCDESHWDLGAEGLRVHKASINDFAGLLWLESYASPMHMSCLHLEHLSQCTLSHGIDLELKHSWKKFTLTTPNFSDIFWVYRLV